MTDVICCDGLCPYVPCKDYPKCRHTEHIFKLWRKVTKNEN